MNVKLYTPTGSEVTVPVSQQKSFLEMGYSETKPRGKGRTQPEPSQDSGKNK